MRYYQPNPACSCGRCSTRGLMGPAVLVTLGLLFLMENMSDYPLQRTWPIMLIVIGAIKLARYVIPDSGHVNPVLPYPPPYGAVPNSQPPYPGQTPASPAGGPFAPPPPPPIAGSLGDGNSENEVHNG